MWTGTWVLALGMYGPVLVTQLVMLPISNRTVWDLQALYDPTPIQAVVDTVLHYSQVILGVPISGGLGASPEQFGTFFVGADRAPAPGPWCRRRPARPAWVVPARTVGGDPLVRPVLGPHRATPAAARLPQVLPARPDRPRVPIRGRCEHGTRCRPAGADRPRRTAVAARRQVALAGGRRERRSRSWWPSRSRPARSSPGATPWSTLATPAIGWALLVVALVVGLVCLTVVVVEGVRSGRGAARTSGAVLATGPPRRPGRRAGGVRVGRALHRPLRHARNVGRDPRYFAREDVPARPARRRHRARPLVRRIAEPAGGRRPAPGRWLPIDCSLSRITRSSVR